MVTGVEIIILVCSGIADGVYAPIASAYYPECLSTTSAIATVGTMINNYGKIKEDIQKRRGKRKVKTNNILLAIHMLESAGECLNDSAREEALKLYEGENFSSNGTGTIEFRKKQLDESLYKKIYVVLDKQFVNFYAMKPISPAPADWMVYKINPDESEGEEKRIMKVFKESWKDYDGFDPDKYTERGFNVMVGKWLPGLSESLSEEEIEYGWELVKKKWMESLQKINSNGLYTVQHIPFSHWTNFAEDIGKLDDYHYFRLDEIPILDYYKQEAKGKPGTVAVYGL